MLGWIGTICFAVGPIVQALHTISTGDTRAFSWIFLGLWFAGEVTFGIYTVRELGVTRVSIPFLINYGLNIAALFVLIGYKAGLL